MAASYIIITNIGGVDSAVMKPLRQPDLDYEQRRLNLHCIMVDECHLATSEELDFMRKLMYPYSCGEKQIKEFMRDGLSHHNYRPTSFLFISGTPWSKVKSVRLY
jgi:hypothetical protein